MTRSRVSAVITAIDAHGTSATSQACLTARIIISHRDESRNCGVDVCVPVQPPCASEKASTVFLRGRSGLCVPERRQFRRADASVESSRVCRRPRHDRWRHFGIVRIGRSGLLQFHRLRTLRAPHSSPRRVRDRQRRRTFHHRRRAAARESREAAGVRVISSSAAVAGAEFRRPGGTHSAHIRSVCAQDVPGRQSADRLPAGVPVPHVTPA